MTTTKTRFTVRGADGRPFGCMTVGGPFEPVAESFRYEFDSEAEAKQFAASVTEPFTIQTTTTTTTTGGTAR